MSGIKAWSKVGDVRLAAQYHGKRLIIQDFKNPDTQKVVPFSMLETPDAVVALALTPKDEVILVKEFRQGRNCVDLELPGGSLEKSTQENVPKTTLAQTLTEEAERELREETGFGKPTHTDYLGYVDPDGRNLTTKVHIILFRGCTRVCKPSPDENEIIEVELLPFSNFLNGLLYSISANPVTYTAAMRSLPFFGIGFTKPI